MDLQSLGSYNIFTLTYIHLDSMYNNYWAIEGTFHYI